MRLHRRTMLIATLAASGMGIRAARAAALPERSLGRPDAPLQVTEFYSLTCPHCAAFAQETFPRIKTTLIDTGRLRWIYGEFPLDRVALMASQVALSLPPERYEPFVKVLFANQDRWVFARGINYTEELFKYAALAGMSRSAFEAAINDNGLRDAIVEARQKAVDKYQIDSTPTFIHGEDKKAGDMSYEDFTKWLGVAAS